MRKVTREVCEAFCQRASKRVGNTHTDGESLFLHGNKFAEWRGGALHITNAGWPTVTTKERLNGLPGVCVHQKNHEWYLNGHEWSGGWVRVEAWEPVPNPRNQAISSCA